MNNLKLAGAVSVLGACISALYFFGLNAGGYVYGIGSASELQSIATSEQFIICWFAIAGTSVERAVCAAHDPMQWPFRRESLFGSQSWRFGPKRQWDRRHSWPGA